MAVFGLAHCADTKVGDDVILGVGGGERKKVSIAEAALTKARLRCRDNSSRGLDSANAVNFCQNLRRQADVLGTASAVTLYQAPQSAHDLFNTASPSSTMAGRSSSAGGSEAKAYFEELGFVCPPLFTRFLVSLWPFANERCEAQGGAGRPVRVGSAHHPYGPWPWRQQNSGLGVSASGVRRTDNRAVDENLISS
ncbi:multidrug resistance protein CDR1 [Moelleriella libera RCEF 2490]|uniref:Multidrug resistance protein CDR1 n=1 Tax=Moelleriella libera RCEF 2490 TaxID=1081109 RepID=A0A168ACI1_9HYPO|nr:multidrug resistance protein CDR1 [Moelleriella libera RCEF 2490]